MRAEVPSELMGEVIGPKGSTINTIKGKLGIDIQIPDRQEGQTDITLTGEKAFVEKAKKLEAIEVTKTSLTCKKQFRT